MKILRLLNKKNLSIIFFMFLSCISNADEQPVDIWNINENKKDADSISNKDSDEQDKELKEDSVSDIYKMQSQKQTELIELDQNLKTQKIKIFGLYDPEDNGLDINMWSNSDGDQLKNIFNKLNNINLSSDAKEIMNITLLTNAHIPKKNITEKEFLKLKSDWLIKNLDLDLIEEYLIKNQILNLHPELTRFLVNEYLSRFEIKKACQVFLKNLEPIDDKYLSKFNVYCLISENKRDEAQLNYDLKKELGILKDKYFEKKINFLLGYDSKVDNSVSEKTILDFHLAHQTNPNFFFEPGENTSKIIWKYLSSANLLNSLKQIEISELDKISVLEKATHNKNYSENDLFNIYKRFQFNINQLLNANEAHKSLSGIESRALIYQKILLVSDVVERLKLLKILKNLFENENIGFAFDIKLKEFLNKIEPTDVPDNLTSFYYTNITLKKDQVNEIKFNNDVLHQSKLINYFNGDYSKSKIEKDVNNFLKKIKKNKKYFFSKKDQIFLESLKSDSIEISKKYNDLYKVDVSVIPSDIQVMINNNEKGTALLRIVELIGQDKLDRIDDDTIFFIINTLNQLNIDLLRNKLLLKVLPLKV